MFNLKQFLNNLMQIPKELYAALVRILVVILLGILQLFYCLLRLFKKRKCKENHDACLEKDKCGRIPPHVKRRPDPCIYSQFYRSSQGLSVTWNNPDIEIFLPNGTLVDSSSLLANTDYILKARISNSSFDPALATVVRCYYRPWSFNSPDKVPIEVNPNGTEKMVLVDIAPWGSSIAEFKWRTPHVASAHFCIQVECLHPDDINPDNNLGQENTNVISASANETITVQAMLTNVENRERVFRFITDAYEIKGQPINLKLQTKKYPLVKKSPFKGLKNYLLTVDQKDRRVVTRSKNGPFYTHYKYLGWDELKDKQKRGKFPIPQDWGLAIDGDNASDRPRNLKFAAGEQKAIDLQVKVPANAISGQKYPLNILALNPAGKIAGGVTLLININ